MIENDVGMDELAAISELHDPNTAAQDDLADAQDLEEDHIRNADSISAEFARRMSEVGSLHRNIVKAKSDIEAGLETLAEMKADEEVYQNYIRDDPVAREYVDNLLELIRRYQELVDNFLPANIALHSTVEQLEDVVDEQQLRHDESFVLEHTKEVVQDIRESFQDSMASLKQSHESTNEELLNRFDRVLDRHSRLSENQARMQELQAETVAMLQEFASSMDTARTGRIEDRLARIEKAVSEDTDEE